LVLATLVLCKAADHWTGGGERKASATGGRQWLGTQTGQATDLAGWRCSEETGSPRGGAQYKELAAKLEQRRRERDQSKPLDELVADLEVGQKRKQAQVQPAKAAVEEAREVLHKAAEDFAAAEKAAAAKANEEDKLKAQLLGRHQKQVEQASWQRGPVRLGERALSQPAELEQVLGLVPATQALLVPVLRAVDQFEGAPGQ